MYPPGLSPHIRGNESSASLACSVFGSIPAHTGERLADLGDDRDNRVYPRTYGGTSVRRCRRAVPRGLSPHIRGNGHQGPEVQVRPGSIPAHTGERVTREQRIYSLGVYPRTYGGTLYFMQRQCRVVGLSPHIRGNVIWSISVIASIGSIPAHTGERRCHHLRVTEPRVYPRTYGGTLSASPAQPSAGGLSPHIRGNGHAGDGSGGLLGSIPAHTGERTAVPSAISAVRVYPRTYGGTATPAFPVALSAGLSPHIRGNAVAYEALRTSKGSIPAHTGERRCL